MFQILLKASQNSTEIIFFALPFEATNLRSFWVHQSTWVTFGANWQTRRFHTPKLLEFGSRFKIILFILSLLLSGQIVITIIGVRDQLRCLFVCLFFVCLFVVVFWGGWGLLPEYFSPARQTWKNSLSGGGGGGGGCRDEKSSSMTTYQPYRTMFV